jgi:hypothetical protein
MDNLTHSLVGLAAAKAGLEKLSWRNTAVCASNAPDADIAVWRSVIVGRFFSTGAFTTQLLERLPWQYCPVDFLLADQSEL